jgi:RimJ/RimL family protein N-acetyltransferase
MQFEHYSIRLLENSDVEPYFLMVGKNRKRLEDFFTGTVSKTKTYDDTKIFVAEMVQKSIDKLYYPFLIIDNNTNDIVGFFDIKNIDWNIPKAELGAYTDEHFAGTGLTTKAFAVFVNYCFTHFKFVKLFLRTHQNNTAAQRVAQKCGFEKEGTIRKDYKTTNGELVDLIYYGKINMI